MDLAGHAVGALFSVSVRTPLATTAKPGVMEHLAEGELCFDRGAGSGSELQWYITLHGSHTHTYAHTRTQHIHKLFTMVRQSCYLSYLAFLDSYT